MGYANITYEVGDGRARIVLNRPEKLNALSPALLEELSDALWSADSDTRVHAVAISGAGPCFSAGYDLAGGYAFGPDADPSVPRRTGRTIDDDSWYLERQQALRMAIFDMHKPVIAQVHGHCLAGGTDVALLCDIVIAADDSTIGFPPARDLGALPNNMWLFHCGPQWAKRLTMTGDRISGADAAKIGLVMKSVPGELLEREVDGLLDRLALIDPDLLSTNKRVINLGLELMGARTCSAWLPRWMHAVTSRRPRRRRCEHCARTASGRRCTRVTPGSPMASCASTDLSCATRRDASSIEPKGGSSRLTRHGWPRSRVRTRPSSKVMRSACGGTTSTATTFGIRSRRTWTVAELKDRNDHGDIFGGSRTDRHPRGFRQQLEPPRVADVYTSAPRLVVRRRRWCDALWPGGSRLRYGFPPFWWITMTP